MLFSKIVVGFAALAAAFGFGGFRSDPLIGSKATVKEAESVSVSDSAVSAKPDCTKWILPSVGTDIVNVAYGAGAGVLSYGEVQSDGTAFSSKNVGTYVVYQHSYNERDLANVEDNYCLALNVAGLAKDIALGDSSYLFIGAKPVDSSHILSYAAVTGTDLYSACGISDWVTATYSGFTGFVIPACMINQLSHCYLESGSDGMGSACVLSAFRYKGYSAADGTDTSSSSGTAITSDQWASAWHSFWECLFNWFKGVFTKWKFDCFITNAEWSARFGK